MPYSFVMMVTISLASLRMRVVSHVGALPGCNGRLAMPVLCIVFCVISVAVCVVVWLMLL